MICCISVAGKGAVFHIRQHRHRRQTIAMPDDAFLEAGFQRRHLIQWHAASILRLHRQVAQQPQRMAFMAVGRALSTLISSLSSRYWAHRHTRERRLQRSGQIRSGNA